MKRKGVFPYEYLDNEEKLKDSSLPAKELFYSKLNEEDISEEDYNHAKEVWRVFRCNTLGEYSDLYLLTDVLLLCDVFEYFRKTMMCSHKVDPAHYFTAPGMTWDAMLKCTQIKLDLLTDYEMIMMIERGIRGGICQVSHRYAKANNKYLPNYDPHEDTSYLMYLDANNLYGYAMSQPLPMGEFQWITNLNEIDEHWIADIEDNGDYGYIFEADVDYPQILHDLHSDFPFLPESVVPPNSNSKIKKLIPHLSPKLKYVVHYKSLKQAIHYGLRVLKIHRVLKFKQSFWLRPYILLNTELRKKAKNAFEKDFYKLLINAVFGKTMESIRKRMDIRLVTDERKVLKLIAKPNFKDRTIYSENLVAIHMGKTKLFFNKPMYVGQAILDISKTVMYDFHYNIMQKKYPHEKIKLLYTDTDSLIYLIHTNDVYDDMKSMLEYFDTSDYPPTHQNFSLLNKKVLGKFKDELNGEVMTSFIGLRPKMYALKKKAKGVKTASLQKCITFEDYENILFNNTELVTPMRMFQSKQHRVTTVEVHKKSLTSKDDKRVILEDDISTLPYGHYLINSSIL